MTDVPFPVLTTPGRSPQSAGGRLINCFPEKLAATAGKPYAYWRVPGLTPWGTTPGTNFRGSLLVGNVLYVVVNNTVYTFSALGGAGNALSGALPGTAPVFMSRNNAATPDIVVVSPGDGAFIIAAGAVSTYPGGVIGQPNSVVFNRSFFIFTYGNGQTRASDPNSINLNSLNFASAESKPDTLFRPIPLGNGQLLLCGDASIEVWGGLNDTGYPFSYIATIARGVIGPNAIAGHQDGFGKGIFLVGDDNKVSMLDGYTPVPISVPDLDLLIETDPNKTAIIVSVYVSMGHGFVVVQGTGWCWEYDTTLQSWHERKSYLKEYWRGRLPVNAFGSWISGDTDSGNLATLDGTFRAEFGVNAVQSFSIVGAPTGGTFTLTYNGQTTAAMPYNATAAQIQTALQALSSIGAGNVACTGGPLGGTVTVTFRAQMAALPALPITSTTSYTGDPTARLPIAIVNAGSYGNPLRQRIETGPLGAFPNAVRINGIELYLTKGAGVATGRDPQETDPAVEISISRDGGQTWTSPRVVQIGRQSLTAGRVRAAIWGHADVQGVRWRFDQSAAVPFGFMGADMQSDVLR